MSVRIVLNRATDRRMLRGDAEFSGVRTVAHTLGDRVRDAAGDGFETSGHVGRNRYRVIVSTATFEAILAESQDNVLTSALDAARG